MKGMKRINNTAKEIMELFNMGYGAEKAGRGTLEKMRL
jgi:hypothetical protein